MIYISSVIIFFLLLFFFIKIANIINLIDYPDKRKKHEIKTPLVGGLSIFITLFILFIISDNLEFFNIIILSTFLILLIGFFDDKYQLSAYLRLIFQLIIISLIVSSGTHIYDLGKYYKFSQIELGVFKIFLTFLAVMCLTNAFNFIDGLDGLASGLGIISISSFLFFNYFLSDYLIENALIYIFILNLSLFFITNIFNYNPLKSFLGDAGSTSIGFFISWILIFYTMPENRIIHPVLTIWCITLPIYEFLAVILRRIFLNKNPFSPDNLHIHHKLISIGFSKYLALTLLLCLALFFNLLGLVIFEIFGPSMTLISYVILFIFYYIFCEKILKSK